MSKNSRKTKEAARSALEELSKLSTEKFNKMLDETYMSSFKDAKDHDFFMSANRKSYAGAEGSCDVLIGIDQYKALQTKLKETQADLEIAVSALEYISKHGANFTERLDVVADEALAKIKEK